MAEAGAPPLRWLLQDAQRRRAAYRYWGYDTFMGVLNTVMHYAVMALPTDVCSALGSVLGGFSGRYRYREADARARQMWRRLRPDASDGPAVDAAMARAWRQVGRTMAEYSVLHRMMREERVVVEGVEHLDAARAAGKPRLVMALHLGNWEILGATLCAVGHPGSGIYQPPDNRFEHRIAVRARLRYGARLFPPGRRSTRAVVRDLAAKENIVIVYVAECVNGHVFAPRFGRPRRLEGNLTNVARLAEMTGAAVIPAYAVRTGSAARFHVRFLPPVDLVRTGARQADLEANVAKLDALIEPIVRAHLDQWFYLFEFSLDT